ncbi:methionyl-tRNA formyltransferase [Galbitalea soli]|uniref:Methionyl-tRNA formyltransferase n=1 Tax=Galbitalea soli TaxID=1268042 RepID=A0A7C9TPR0_9MICO|nr:methionyl-tRNA formyltransferase [Galbitalea soli]NEM90202.1 methionyl-tRNA formyltransferase [Galbitalea soli]NYJ30910.1 methionyl-tRNA formyltransferase [Galbitalea soli]
MTPLTLVFAGSPAAAVPSLRRLASGPHRIAAVVTREDSPVGRRGVLTPTAVGAAAAELGLPIIHADRLDAEATEAITALNADLGVIVAYGGLVREPLLSALRLGWINLHFSVLPRWRGAAPVQRAIIAGDELSGASVFQLVDELDAGDVFGQLTQPIGAHETAGHLLDSLAGAGAELLARVVDALAEGTARAEPQRGDVTLAPKLTVADGVIDWTAPAETVYALIRGVTPEPGASTFLDGTRVKVLEATIARDAAALPPGRFQLVGRALLVGTATTPVELVRVHPAGRTAMAAADWWRGRPATSAVATADAGVRA